MNRTNGTSDVLLTRTRYGNANPERVENALWQEAIQQEWSGYDLRQHSPVETTENDFRTDFSHSTYRDATPGPFWSWNRFGRTSTLLPDGRLIHIAGEHEDSYDYDFCIYNDVVVEYPDGSKEFYLYPKDVFPPTDFHSATLICDEIILIGSLGYHDLRRVGETQVLKLDTRTLHIEEVATTGKTPGWRSRHLAERLDDSKILIVGGQVLTEDGLKQNTDLFELDLTTMVWRAREHSDPDLFPIADATYRKHKSPGFGATNPELSDNPFWLEMARRRWPPSRARLHFGDFAAPEHERVQVDDDRGRTRPLKDIVWTAAREDTLELSLPDGRQFLIGGEIRDYGDEYADPWVYNDVIVTQQDGTIEIRTYPIDVFPHIKDPVGVVRPRDIYIFGIPDIKRHPELSRAPVVMWLSLSSYEISRLPVEEPSARVNIYRGSDIHDDDNVSFPLVRYKNADPQRRIAFNLITLEWSKPFLDTTKA